MKRGDFNMKKTYLDWAALILIVVGAVNWGLAVFDFNLVTFLLDAIPYAVKVVYGLVGLAGLYEIYFMIRH